ncbi:50S ribosomal protein L1 [Patescibacteria group bacterium]|nr:50S ribosomal protein L1 [Patescibacteria group bacterium]MBU0777200.1 50S ribosomal protein L1 [Patescibacteria group bacterium]MBU0845895.1 50S ribosomal protein L1 [Patescibacteria group bacterium]MBU0922922.1 50S ribosomal protein L1 [Patescibacteria group bacterium]MBU1066345.1 50S ribosomal protein L1 [Patescibacteria group bacterium]
MGKTKTAIISGELEPEVSKGKGKKKGKKQKSSKEKKGVKVPGLKGGERVVAVEAEPIAETEEKGKTTKEIERKVKVRGKKYIEAQTKVNKTKLYPLTEAIKLVKETSYSTFDGTINLHVVVKKAGISANALLPHSTGKEKKIEVAKESTIKKLEKGNVDFDILLATADMMPKLVPFAKILGPKGLMPNPKTGTLIKDIKEANKFSANKINLKTEKKAPLIHTPVGKVSSKEKDLSENIEAVLNGIGKRQIIKAYLAPTMGPSVKVQI